MLYLFPTNCYTPCPVAISLLSRSPQNQRKTSKQAALVSWPVLKYLALALPKRHRACSSFQHFADELPAESARWRQGG